MKEFIETDCMVEKLLKKISSRRFSEKRVQSGRPLKKFGNYVCYHFWYILLFPRLFSFQKLEKSWIEFTNVRILIIGDFNYFIDIDIKQY